MKQTSEQNVAVIEEVEQVVAWLKDKHTTTWGGHGWDVTDPKEAVLAAEWFLQQIMDYNDYKEH